MLESNEEILDVDFRVGHDGTETWEERREPVYGIIETRFVTASPWHFASRQPSDKETSGKEVNR